MFKMFDCIDVEILQNLKCAHVACFAVTNPSLCSEYMQVMDST